MSNFITFVRRPLPGRLSVFFFFSGSIWVRVCCRIREKSKTIDGASGVFPNEQHSFVNGRQHRTPLLMVMVMVMMVVRSGLSPTFLTAERRFNRNGQGGGKDPG